MAALERRTVYWLISFFQYFYQVKIKFGLFETSNGLFSMSASGITKSVTNI